MSYGTYCRLNVHISASKIEVIRAARKKLAPNAFLNSRDQVKSFYRLMIRYHEKERRMFISHRF